MSSSRKQEPSAAWKGKLYRVAEEAVQPEFATAAGHAMRRDVKEWIQTASTVTCDPEAVRLYMRSLVDVAALRFRPATMPERSLPAAGLPWLWPCSSR